MLASDSQDFKTSSTAKTSKVAHDVVISIDSCTGLSEMRLTEPGQRGADVGLVDLIHHALHKQHRTTVSERNTSGHQSGLNAEQKNPNLIQYMAIQRRHIAENTRC